MNDTQRQILNVAKRLAEIEIDILYRKEDLARLSFEEFGPQFRRAVGVAAIWAEESFVYELTSQEQNDALRFLNQLDKRLTDILTYDPTNTQNAVGERLGRVDAIRSAVDEFLEGSPRISSLLASYALRKIQKKDIGLTELKDEVHHYIEKKLDDFAQPLRRAQNTLDEIKKLKEDAESAVAAVRGLTQTESLQKYSRFYGDEANRCKVTAVLWGVGSACLTAVLLWYLIWMAFWWTETHMQKETLAAIQAGAAKLALFSVAFYITAWCGRNFRAQWHLYIINRHRSNTLNALDTFANSAKESTTREGILLHASQAIFSHNNTGFLPDASDSPTSPSILEIVRGSKD